MLGNGKQEKNPSKKDVQRRAQARLKARRKLDPKYAVLSRQIPAYPNERVRQVLTTFEGSLGGRPAIREALDGAQDPKVMKLAILMADPRYGSYSLLNLLKTCDLTVTNFLQAFTKESSAKAYAAALAQVHKKLPLIAADIADRALPHMIKCPDCKGLGHLYNMTTHLFEKEDCPRCGGLRKVVEPPELERVKLAAQVGGLLKGGGPNTIVQVNQQFNTTDAPGSNPDFREAVGRVLHPAKQRFDETNTTDIDAIPVDPVKES